MLVPLAVGGLILLRARRDYPRDVATAIASEAAACPTGDDDQPSDEPSEAAARQLEP